jgi:predicted MFS family arabinose efflux permease
MRYPLIVHLLFLGIFVVGWAEMSIVGLLELIAGDFATRVERASIVVTLYSLSFAGLAPAVIVMVRRFGPRRVLPGLMAVMGLANLACALSTSVWMMAVSRIVLAAASGAFAATTLGTVVKLVPPALSGRAMGYILVGFGGSLVLGIPASVFVADTTGWRVPFLVIAGVCALLCLLLSALLRRPEPGRSAEAERDVAERSLLVRLLRLPPSTHICQLITFFWISGYSIVFTYLAVILVNGGLELREVSVVFVVLGVACLIGAHIGGILTDRIGAMRAAFVALVLHGSILMAAPFLVSSFTTACIFASLWGAVSWSSTPAIQTFIARHSGNFSDVVLSLNNAILHIGIALGAWLGAAMLHVKPTTFYATAAGLVFAGGFVALALSRLSGEATLARAAH